MKLVIISDLHLKETNDWDNINTITEHMISRIKMKLRQGEKVIYVVLGDIVDKCGDGDSKQKFNQAKKFLELIRDNFDYVEFYFVPGNHELKNADIKEFNDFSASQGTEKDFIFSIEKSVHSIEIEGTNLIFVDSNLTRNSKQSGKIDVTLLKKNIKLNMKNLIFMHHPPCKQEGIERPISNSEQLIATHANFVFYGHQHGFVDIPDFLEKDTDIHSVGALLKNEEGVKNEFLLLDISDGRINCARRYDYVNDGFHSKLLFPQKCDLQEESKTFIPPPKYPNILNRKYRATSNGSPNNNRQYTFDRTGEIDETTLIRNHNFVLLLAEAGMGKTYSLSKMCNAMSDDADYFPLWLSFRYSDYKTIKRYLHYAQHHTINNKTPILFLDGLDELRNEDLYEVKRDLWSAISGGGDVELKIIISARANFQNTIIGFEQFNLVPLSPIEIKKVANTNGIENTEYFFDQISSKDYTRLSQNPFYLFEMIKIFKENDSLPRKADLFKYIIQIRLKDSDARQSNHCNGGIIENEFMLMDKLKKLAFFMNVTQQHLLPNIKYTEILSPAIRHKVQETGLLTKRIINSEVFWEFEHRNFSEYLAADFISNIDFCRLLSIITSSDQKKKLRPSLVNMVGFILSLRVNDDLKKWLMKEAKDDLCSLKPDSLTTMDRTQIFKSFFENCLEKNIPLYSKHFGKELAEYFQCQHVIDYLVDCIEQNRSDFEVESALYFLQFCTDFYEKEEVLLDMIRDRFIKSDVLETIVKVAIRVVTAIFTVQQTINIDEIVSVIKSDERVEVIEATCELIVTACDPDDHSEYLLNVMKNEAYLRNSYFAQKNLKEAISSFNNTNNILNAVRTMAEYNGYIRLFQEDVLFSTLLEKLCKSQTTHRTDLIEDLVSILLVCSYEHKMFEIAKLKQCLSCLEAERTAFKLIAAAELNELDMMYAIEAIMDEGLAPILIELYKNGELNDKIVKWYALRLPETSPIFQAINIAVTEKEGKPIEREEKVDWEKQRSDGFKKYFDSLFDQSHFTQLKSELIQYYPKGVVCKDLFKESYHNIPTNRKDLNYIAAALLRWGSENIEVSKFFLEVDWKGFSMYQIIQALKQDKSTNIQPEQKEVIESYYTNVFATTDFEKEPLSKHTLNVAQQIIFLINNFGFSISDDKLLEFLALPWFVFDESVSSTELAAINFIEAKIQDNEKLLKKVTFNLKQREINPYAKQTYILYCLKHRLPIAVEMATNFLKEREHNISHFQGSAIEYLIAIKGERYVDSLVNEDMTDAFLLKLSATLLKENKNLINVLVQKNKNSENKLTFLAELIKFNSRYALSTYIKLAKKENSIPDKHDNLMRIPEITSAIKWLQNIDLLDQVAELLVLSVSDDFKDNDGYNLCSSTLAAIRNMIRIDIQAVKDKLLQLASENPYNQVLKSHCNQLLESIDSELRVLSDKPKSSDEAIELIVHNSKETPQL